MEVLDDVVGSLMAKRDPPGGFGAPLTLPATCKAMKCQDLEFDCKQKALHSSHSSDELGEGESTRSPDSTIQQRCTNMSAAASREPF